MTKAVNDSQGAKQQLKESQCHNKTMECIAMEKRTYKKTKDEIVYSESFVNLLPSIEVVNYFNSSVLSIVVYNLPDT